VKVGFYPSKLKISFFAKNFKIHGKGPLPPFRHPCLRSVRLLTKANSHFLLKLLVYVPAWGPVFEGPKRFSYFFNGLVKYNINSLKYHHQSIPKFCFTIISVFRWTVVVSQNVFAVSNVKLKTLEGPTVFCKRSIRCQRKSKCIARFSTPLSKFYSKNGDCLQ